ncbi:hypothetical protein HPB50_024771 [Hyalomma asiaticum]|uniref:Uncharacterized protein n=1 Tax=Hyalomma asiaticum TaxID=266040 RepID=A0ACB7TFG6_HYAAI|nr:hypothetical protein HPB50_024771 [Hyalomma asiaticum]
MLLEDSANVAAADCSCEIHELRCNAGKKTAFATVLQQLRGSESLGLSRRIFASFRRGGRKFWSRKPGSRLRRRRRSDGHGRRTTSESETTPASKWGSGAGGSVDTTPDQHRFSVSGPVLFVQEHVAQVWLHEKRERGVVGSALLE